MLKWIQILKWKEDKVLIKLLKKHKCIFFFNWILKFHISYGLLINWVQKFVWLWCKFYNASSFWNNILSMKGNFKILLSFYMPWFQGCYKFIVKSFFDSLYLILFFLMICEKHHEHFKQKYCFSIQFNTAITMKCPTCRDEQWTKVNPKVHFVHPSPCKPGESYLPVVLCIIDSKSIYTNEQEVDKSLTILKCSWSWIPSMDRKFGPVFKICLKE